MILLKTNFIIFQDGKLRIEEIKLVPATDDLLVFISTHIGEVADLGGVRERNKDYPFSDKKSWSLQEYYLSRSLVAIEKYIGKPNLKYKNIKIFLASGNNYEEVLTAGLPSSKIELEALISKEQFQKPVLQPMPSVAQKMLDLGVLSSTGVLVIGSFGFDSASLCNSLELKKILKSTSPKNINILSFVSIDHISEKVFEYTKISSIPIAFACPDNPAVTLVAPSDYFLGFPEKMSKGLLAIINKGFEND